MTNYQTTYYDNVIAIPDAVFEDLGCANSFYFEKDFLDAFAKSTSLQHTKSTTDASPMREKGNRANSSIEHRYLLIKEKEIAVALVIMQQFSVMVDNAPEKLSIQSKLASSLQHFLKQKEIHVALCGNVFLSGNYGVFIKPEAQVPGIYQHIAQELKSLRTRQKASVFFMKDFKEIEILDTQVVTKHQFQPFAVAPNMRLHLEWRDYDDYKKALRSKYRIKVNKADSQSADMVVKPFEALDIRAHLDKLNELYCNITDKAIFATVNLNLEIYALLKERFRESVFINTYWYKEEMVGFCAAFKVKNTLDAHYIGIDYNCNKELAIYPRILNDYVRLGFDLGCDEVNFGRTSSEIKSTLGALPEDLTCYVRHRRTLANLFFKPLVRKIKMRDYKQHRPFKKTQ